MSSPDQGGPARLTPAMSSRRLQVLDFIRCYSAGHNESPSLSEIAAGCGISRGRAQQLVGALVKKKLLVRGPGPRGLLLPSEIEEAKRKLRAAGFAVDEDFHQAPYTDSRLLPLVELDYQSAGRSGGSVGGSGGGSKTGARRRG